MTCLLDLSFTKLKELDCLRAGREMNNEGKRKIRRFFVDPYLQGVAACVFQNRIIPAHTPCGIKGHCEDWIALSRTNE